MTRIPVISGALGGEEDLAGVLEALGLTRQLSCVEISSPLGALEGTIWTKSGQLLEATAGARSGLDALRYLLDRAGTYEVYRAEGKVDGGIVPLMSLADAIEQARAAAPEAPSRNWSTGMQPIGSIASELEPALPRVDEVATFTNGHPAAETPWPRAAPAPAAPPIAARPPSVAPPRAPAAAVPAWAAPSAPKHESRTHVSVPAPAAPAPPSVASAPFRAQPLPTRDPLVTSSAGPVLAVFANKGGVGKTTFSLNLAVTLARRGLRTYLVDTDPRNDVGTALAARRDTSMGLFDVLDGSAQLPNVVLETALPGFSILPAGGAGLPEDRFQAATMRADRLAAVLAALSAPGGIVVVDTPPGLRGITHSVLRASTHAVAIVQAEPIALRSAVHVPRALDALPARERPALVGVVLNMLDRRVGASLGMLEEACRVFGADAVLDIAIPRSGVFIEASESGAPVALLDGDSSHAIGWIFESLASAVLSRAGLSTPKFAEMRLL